MHLHGQTALITGGSAGIGLAFARALTAGGNLVYITGRDPTHLAAAQAALPQVRPLQADMSKPPDLLRLIGTIEREVGALTILINNAAIQYNDAFMEVAPADGLVRIADEVATNLTGLMQLSLLSLPLLRQTPQAAIINVSSGLGMAPKKSAPVYSATKAGVHIFSKALRYQMQDGGYPIRVVEAILPPVATAMTAGRTVRTIPPERVVTQVLRGLSGSQDEIHVGAVRPFFWVYRLAPRIAERMLRNS